nr:nitronate monooxygenase [Hyphobacterium sp. SN044]
MARPDSAALNQLSNKEIPRPGKCAGGRPCSRPLTGKDTMIETEITRRFGLSTPILNAGMAMVARPDLAAAVSNAGGLGMLGADIAPADALRAMVRAVKARTSRPFGVDLLAPMITDAHLDVLAEESVALCVVFWGNPTSEQVARIKDGGTAFWMQVGSVDEARDAQALGAEAIIVQGLEAGGHNRSVATTFNLLPVIRDAVAPIPVIAAGGICDGRSMAAALALGAEAVWCGTRFLASHEADAHDGYKARVLEAGVEDTISTTLFGPEMPHQPMRVIRNAATDEWADRVDEALAVTAGQTAGILRTPGGDMPLPRFSAYLPTRDVAGDLDQLCLTAGQSAGKIRTLQTAGDIVRQMSRDALQTITELAIRSRHPGCSDGNEIEGQ